MGHILAQLTFCAQELLNWKISFLACVKLTFYTQGDQIDFIDHRVTQKDFIERQIDQKIFHRTQGDQKKN